MTTPQNPDTELGTLPKEQGVEIPRAWLEKAVRSKKVPCAICDKPVPEMFGACLDCWSQIAEAEDDVKAGRFMTADDFFAEMRELLVPGSALPNPDQPREALSSEEAS